MKTFTKIFCLIVFFILMAASLFFLANIVIKVPDDSFSIFRNNNTGEIKILSPGTHYLLEGLIPGRVFLRNFKNTNNQIFYPKVKIPMLETINDESLMLRMTLNVSYIIDYNKIQISRLFIENDNDIINEMIKARIQSNIKSELLPYLSPYYSPELVINDSYKVIEKVFKKLKQQGIDTGFEIQKFELIGPIDLPAKDIIISELKYLNELKGIEKNNKKELLILQNKLLSEQKFNENYYNKLREMSKLIKDNPDLLKYIYIDKMADKVKVILTSDKLGIPPGLINDDAEKSKANGELDNLR